MIFNEEFIEWHLRAKDKLKINPQPFLDENSSDLLNDSSPLENQVEIQNLQENISDLSKNEYINATNAHEKTINHIDDPSILNVSLQNQVGNMPMVDGVLVSPNLEHFIVEGNIENQRVNESYWRLRPKRADIFLSIDSKVDYLAQFIQYLDKCGLDIKNYDSKYHYLPSDILILDDKERPEQGLVVYLQQGKREVWEFLQKHIPEKLIHGKK